MMLISKTNANGSRRSQLYTWRGMRSEVRASVVESLDDAVVLVDEGRVVVAWNAPMAHLTGCDRAHALGRRVDEILSTVLPSTLWTRAVDLALAGERGHGPAVAAGTVWLEPRWAPRADAPGALLILRDVTGERKRALFVRALETVGR